MSRLTRFALAGLVALAVMPLAAAGDIRLATLVPTGTTWHKALLEMGNTWKKNTDGRVTLTVFADGQQGDESTTVKKMRLETLRRRFLTAAGLAELDEAFNVFAMPFFFESRRGGSRRREEADADLRAAAASQGLPPARLGHRRLGPGLLEEAAALARRREGGEALHDQGRRQVGAVVRRRTASTRCALLPADIPAQLKLAHRPHRHRAQSAVPGALAPDLPRREVHARPSHRAADRRRCSSPTAPGTASAPKTSPR